MTDIEAAIERAAKAVLEFDGNDEAAEVVARAILTAAFPDLMSGKGWLAPMEATEEMVEAGHRRSMDGVGEDYQGGWFLEEGFVKSVFEGMRDAFLSRQQKDEGE